MVLDLYNFWNNHRFIDHRIIYLEREPLRLFRPIPPFEAVPIRPDNPRFCHSLCRQVHICCLTILMIKNSTKENQTKKTPPKQLNKAEKKERNLYFLSDWDSPCSKLHSLLFVLLLCMLYRQGALCTMP